MLTPVLGVNGNVTSAAFIYNVYSGAAQNEQRFILWMQLHTPHLGR